ncbi:MAG: hypothetical protein ABIO70_27460 [Pseudomonadota bacterium]
MGALALWTPLALILLALGACARASPSPDSALDRPACLEGADQDGDGLVLVGYVPGATASEPFDLEAFLSQERGLDEGCLVVTVRREDERGCVERPVLGYCPSPGLDRNIGNAVVYLATFERPANVHRGDSPFAPAQINPDLCSYQTACLGRATAEPVVSAQGEVLGTCEEGPAFADLFCHHDVTAALLDERGHEDARVVGDRVQIRTSCAGASWHDGDPLGLAPLPLTETRTLTVTASADRTLVDLHAEVVLDTDCALWLGNNRRPLGPVELTGPGYADACFADASHAEAVPVPVEGPDGVFWLGDEHFPLAPPMAARLHDGADGAADVALCLVSASCELDGTESDCAFTGYAYAEPGAHPGRAGLSLPLAPYDAWPTWPAGVHRWVLEARLAAGSPSASWQDLCGRALADCGW